MSVSGWDTRSVASAVSMDDRRARQQQQQFSPARSRHPPDVPSRHQSFPVPPPSHHAERDAPARRQSQVPLGRPPQPPFDPYLQQSGGHREHGSPYYEPRDGSQQPRGQSSAALDPQRSQYAEPPPQFQRPQQAPPPPRPPQAPHANGHYAPPRDDYGPPRPTPNGPERPYQNNQQDAGEDYFDSLPPPLPVRRGPGVIPVEMPDHAVRATASPSTASSSEDEPVNIDDVLLGKRWSIHVISHLYQFQRQELSDYAHELVKFLRGHAVMTYGQEFGYSVMIRFTSECVAFQVIEARDLHAEFLIETAEQPQRSGANQRPELEKQESSETTAADIRQRSGSFILYFPKAAEDSNNSSGVRPLAGSRPSRVENGNDGSNGVAAKSDPKYVFLLRGNEELMAWVCSWVQRRFQCVVGLHVVRVTEENLRRVARNWVIEALEREERLEKARQRKAERLRKISAASGEDMTKPNSHKPHDPSAAAWPPRAPLLLKYRSKATTDVVKAFTMTIPWANVRRVHALMDGGVGSALGSVPEVIDRLEHLHFGNLQRDLSAMTLVGVQMDELEVDTQGKVKFFKSSMVHSVLQSFLDIFVVQQVPGPTEPTTTF